MNIVTFTAVMFCNQAFKRLFYRISAALCIGTLFACLDTPSGYNDSYMLESATVIVIRENGDSTLNMQIPANEVFKLAIKISPSEIANDLNITWYKGKTKISENKVYTKDKSGIPDSVSLSDKAGNVIGAKFEITLNTPPKFERLVEPADNAILKGVKNTSYKFQWIASDADNDTLTYELEIDGTAYPTGIASTIYQGNIDFGTHKLRIIVKDPYNNTDTSDTFKFHVMHKDEL